MELLYKDIFYLKSSNKMFYITYSTNFRLHFTLNSATYFYNLFYYLIQSDNIKI